MSGDGSDYPAGSLVETQDDNEDKNHNRQNDVISAVSSAQPGMLLSEGRDNSLWHTIAAATFYEILQRELVICMDDGIVCMDDEVLTL